MKIEAAVVMIMSVTQSQKVYETFLSCCFSSAKSSILSLGNPPSRIENP